MITKAGKVFAVLILLFSFLASSLPIEAAEPAAASVLIRETLAYKKFKSRPVSDFSKLIFLIDRFENSGVVIVYDGHQYKSKFAATVARWFLVRNYKKQTVKEWVMRWCNTSVLSGSLIWVKFPDGGFKLSREVLLAEMAALEKIIEEDAKTEKVSPPVETPAASAEAEPAPTPAVAPVPKP